MKTAALILASGLGTRLRPLTDTIPKCLVPLGGRPLLAYWIDRLAEAGVSRARINTHHLPDAVRTFIVENNQRAPVLLEESYERELLGSAGTVAANRDLADDVDCVVVIYADNLSEVHLGELLAFHAAHSEPMSMLLFHAERPEACGIATLNGDRVIVDFIEKPARPASDLANAGVYVLDADLYREIADLGVRDFGFDVIPRLLGRMRGFALAGYHRDIGTLDSLEQAERDLPDLSERLRLPA